MKKYTHFNYYLLFFCGVATLMAVYGFLGKGEAEPPVKIVYGENFSLDKAADNNIWDNHPYLVAKSRGVILDSAMILNKSLRLKDLIKKNDTTFFRFKKDTLNMAAATQALEIIRRTNARLVVLTDSASARLLDSLRLGVYVIKEKMPVFIEGYRYSYFFQLKRGYIVDNIYVPKKDFPEMTEKYLQIVAK
jgi:hypothetical protein